MATGRSETAGALDFRIPRPLLWHRVTGIGVRPGMTARLAPEADIAIPLKAGASALRR